MEIIKYIADNLLLIVPSTIKQKVIKEICKLDSFFSFKIIDEIQLKQLVCFDYSINAAPIIPALFPTLASLISKPFTA